MLVGGVCSVKKIVKAKAMAIVEQATTSLNLYIYIGKCFIENCVLTTMSEFFFSYIFF